ncbi:MAG: hypothetical protein JRC86_04590 [Deltaproteobacteria bacterium]|nr:hypothetical protein [Deltaproteobacteria bacterium]
MKGKVTNGYARGLRYFLVVGFIIFLITGLTIIIGCSSDDEASHAPTGTISGSVSGTTIIAVADDKIVASDDTSGRDYDLDRDDDGTDDSYSFELRGIPVGKDVAIYIIEGGLIFPLYFGSPETNVFSLDSAGTIELGFVDVVEGVGKAYPESNPASEDFVTGGTETTDIPDVLITPETAGLSLGSLLSYGLDALSDGLVLRANTYFEAAVAEAGSSTSNDADTARFFYALTRVASIGFNTYSDGEDNGLHQLGDFLDAFGIDTSDFTRSNPEAIVAAIPDPLPVPNSPSGSDIQDFLYNEVRAELEGAISLLDEISADFSRTWAEPVEGLSVEVDYGDVLVCRAALKGFVAHILIQYAYDLDVPIAMEINYSSTIQAILAEYTSFLTRSENSDLASTKQYLLDAADDLEAAITSIEAETDDQTDDLVNFSGVTQDEIDEGKATIAYAKSSLSNDSNITIDDNDTPTDDTDDTVINLENFFTGYGIDLRALLPTFAGDAPTGFLPDETFDGTLIKIRGQDPSVLDQDLNTNLKADIFE